MTRSWALARAMLAAPNGVHDAFVGFGMVYAVCQGHFTTDFACVAWHARRIVQPHRRQHARPLPERGHGGQKGRLCMAQRQRQWARISLSRLKAALGNCCNVCGSSEAPQFDCIRPRGHRHHAESITFRATFYWREARQGNLQLLCESCHRRKSARELPGLLNTDPVDVDMVPY
jgi:5-methylcytosine-specific restriction endonuclease McrA